MAEAVPSAQLTRAARSVIAVAAVLILLLAIQPFFVPRDPDRQTVLAWEMYAKFAPKDEFALVTADETRR